MRWEECISNQGEKISRRHLLEVGLGIASSLTCAWFFPACNKIENLFSATGDEFRIRARWWESLPERAVRCTLCPNECLIADGRRGKCQTRENKRGILESLVYSRIVAAHVDPIEKKPFNHFLPGSKAYSIATTGCGLSCRFCQNWQISQSPPENLDAQRITAEALVRRTQDAQAPVIAYTYNEPTVQYEYVIDSARLAKKNGIRAVIVSSGYINERPLKELLPHLSAVKIDLKSFREEFYREICRGTLAPVKRNLALIRQSGVWLEIVVLVIPTLNDSVVEIREMARWIRTNLGAYTPVHFIRFYPMYMPVSYT
ncbi:MAG: AmmeMemoRadiSam system radical SAM enzyme, partial [Spirochaetes bacterium]|nr:AmmeMemoRadiSam system radical SAM enzyme [Spirochaetota bacterium]